MNILQPGAPARKKLDLIQAKISEHQTEIKGLERAPKALVDIKAEVAREVQRFSDNYRSIDLELAGIDVDRKIVGLLVQVIGVDPIVDALVAERVRRIEQSKRAHGLPAFERAQRIQHLHEEIRRLAVNEEKETLRLEGEGHTVIRRADIDGALVLEVWDEIFGSNEAAA